MAAPIVLNNGQKNPALGLGTAGQTSVENITYAISVQSDVQSREEVVLAYRESLKNLGLDYIDIYLIHWSVPLKHKADQYDLVEQWKGMEECVELGLVKSIGFCNFNEEEVTKIVNAAKIKPVMNQIKQIFLCFCKYYKTGVNVTRETDQKMAASLIVLNNGQKIPALGLGTDEKTSIENVTYAISVGYRHIDTAWNYKTEPQVGEAIRNSISAGIVKREDIFVTTKLWNDLHDRKEVVLACRESLKNLGLDYIDLYLIHFPVRVRQKADQYDLVEHWRGMEECVELGLVKSIGFCNFNEEQVAKIVDAARIKPAMNQIELNPLRNQKKIRAFCKEHQITVTAFSPLSAPQRGPPTISFDDPKLIQIGNKYGKSGSQVILRYLVDLGVIPIPNSSNKERMKQNLNIFDFKLTQEEIEIMDGFNQLDGIHNPSPRKN